MPAIMPNPVRTVPAPRRCGFRIRGGIYWELLTGVNGRDYTCRPFVEVDCAALGVRPIGVTMMERDGVWHVLDWIGVWHVLDWIGANHYPTPEDFLMEVRRMGVSRRLPRTVPFERLTPESRLLCIHPNAIPSFSSDPAAGQYRPAIIASYPMSCLAVVNDPDWPGTTHTLVTSVQARTTIPVRLTDT